MSSTNIINWSDVESKLGTLRPVSGGFSLARRGLITLDSGDCVFVKIGVDDLTNRWAKKEINVYRFLEKNNYPHIPRLLSVNNDETGFAISAMTSDKGWDWDNNWTYDRFDKTLKAMDDLALIKPTGDDVSLFAENGLDNDGWRGLIELPDLQIRLHDKLLGANRHDIFDQIDFKREAEKSGKLVYSGDILTHNDIRADNCAWNPATGDICLVDWNWAEMGDRRIDLAATLTHTYQHGVQLIPKYIDRLDADALHWCAGFWFRAAATPIWEGGAESLRDFQLRSGIAAIDLRNMVLLYNLKTVH